MLGKGGKIVKIDHAHNLVTKPVTGILVSLNISTQSSTQVAESGNIPPMVQEVIAAKR